jgi:two-component system response regulator DesR
MRAIAVDDHCVQALRSGHLTWNGASHVPWTLREVILQRVIALQEGAHQVLRLAAEGTSGAEIATKLHLSEGTVRNYLSEAISKLGAGNRIEAARIARMKGWL